MTAPIAIQLYSVRELTQNDFEGVVRKIADIGYVGVEPAGFPSTTPEAAASLFRELGLEVPSAHTKLPLGENERSVLDAMAAIGCTRIIASGSRDRFATLDSIKAVCDEFNAANAVAQANGLTLGYHNHWWEYQPVEGHMPYKVMLDYLAPEVFFQIDTYWVKVAGPDPVDIIKEMGARAPLLHIKDGPGVPDEPMVAVGGGVMDIPAVIRAAAPTAEWHIVELDHCATDMMEAVEQSYAYLISKGLSRGNR
ncbi:MAG: sugar phosphate isomerase/epimerase [Anaerolineae bacterium]